MITETQQAPPAAPSAKEALKPGAYSNVPFNEYLEIPAVNWHTLEPGRKSAKHMRQAMLSPKTSTARMDMGVALDCLIFDGQDRFDDLVVSMPIFDGHPNSKVHKSARASWEEQNAGAIQLTRSEMAQVRGMYEAIRQHPIAWPLLTSGRGRNQLSIVWTDKKTGLLCKGRIDRLALVDSAIIQPGATGKTLCLIDLKSTCEPGVNSHEFPRESARFGYHGQIAFYNDGCVALEPAPILPLIVTPGSEPPHDVVVHRLDAEMSDGKSAMQHGQALYRRLLDMFSAGTKRGVWPGQCENVINPLSLPGYAMERIEAPL